MDRKTRGFSDWAFVPRGKYEYELLKCTRHGSRVATNLDSACPG